VVAPRAAWQLAGQQPEGLQSARHRCAIGRMTPAAGSCDQETLLITLYDVASGGKIGTITDAQLQFMMDQLEEESDEDQDYYVNSDTLDLFEAAGADPALTDLLRKALGDRTEMDIRWERA
jgi:hypothetical protein